MTMDQAKLDGTPALRMQAGGRSRGSWRTQVFLPPGRYTFEGEGRTRGVVSGSAGLRISGGQRRTGLSGTTPDWRPLSHIFAVDDPAGLDVEFICDFYGADGEVWFKLDSLRVRRLPDLPEADNGRDSLRPVP
jgi:hypothetical protein